MVLTLSEVFELFDLFYNTPSNPEETLQRLYSLGVLDEQNQLTEKWAKYVFITEKDGE